MRTTRRRRPERRGKAVLLLAFSLFVGGCGGDGAGRRVTVRFWNGFTGPDGRTMLRLVRRFNEENPDVHVLMQRMEWGTYYNKLFVAGIGRRAPEVFIIHTGVLPRFVRAGFLRSIEDLTAGPGGIDTDDFDPNVWAAVAFEGKHVAVPLDVHPLGMYYNERLLRETGLVDPENAVRVPETREEFLDALRRTTIDRDGDGRPDQWGFVFTWFRTNVYAIMKQFGGRMFTEDLSRCTLDDPRNVEALRFCVDLIRKEGLAPPPESMDSWIGFRQGKVAFAFEGIYMLADLQRQGDLVFGGAPLPRIGPRRATWAGSHTLCLRADLEGPRLEAAWRFIRFLSENSLDWAEGGQVPVRRSLRRTERFRSMRVQSEFARQIPYVRYAPRVPFIFEFFSEYDLAVEKALRGRVDPEEALRTATENINRVIERTRNMRHDEGAGS